ncbi:MAG: choline dehydrogenase [Pseudonocardiales bacterium]|nr:choline dehydrogenase [Pseudonocardiales bacterium]
MRYTDIIVGCGSAGAALTMRLSEDPARQVLVIEAGPDFTDETVPDNIYYGREMSFADSDWGYRAEATDGRRIRFPRGKLIGGSSAVGATIGLRGMPHDYDEWEAAGNKGWGWADVLPYFRKLETDRDFTNELHGNDGPVPIRRFPEAELSSLQRGFVEACVAHGFDRVADHNDPAASGVGSIPSTRLDATRRFTTAAGYLEPARRRPNVTVWADTLVRRVVIESGRASGIELQRAGGTEVVHGDRIVLATGTVSTPFLLLHSGIGPAEELRRIGIDVIADLPGVGDNLVDHPRTGAFMVSRPGVLDRSLPFLQSILRTTSSGSQERNDMQYYMINYFDLKYFPELQMLSGASVIGGVMVCAQRPKSRGRLSLASADPDERPVIDLNFLSDPRDLVTMREGVRLAWELLNSAPLGPYLERPLIVNDTMMADEEMLDVYLHSSIDSTYHPVGTARMGPDGDPGAVVDSDCAVRGVEGLYVCDASIMPNIPSANTNLTSIMIGEKVADQLKGL